MTKYNKDRLFEMMNRVGGMPVLNENVNSGLNDLPIGFSPDDFIPLEDYVEQVPCSTSIQEELPLGAQGKEVDDIQGLFKDGYDAVMKTNTFLKQENIRDLHTFNLKKN